MSPTAPHQTEMDLEQVNRELAAADAAQLVEWAANAFGDGLAMTSSFGAQSAVMLHLVTRVVPDIPVILIDTGYLFPETYRFAQELTDRLKLNLKVYQPRMSAGRLEAVHGKLWEQGVEGLDAYHQIVKIEPMQRALDDLGVTAWLAGLRKQQTDHRAQLSRIERQGEQYKAYPILDWSTRDIHEYLKRHDLPYHPLYEQGYASIGDVHSTRPITDGQDERDGRFHGLKQECGLHLPSTEEENNSRGSSSL